jgi:hypothetical protein
MRPTSTWVRAARARATRTSTIAVGAALLALALAAPVALAATEATPPGGGGPAAAPAPVDADAAVALATDVRATIQPGRGHRYALPPNLRERAGHLLEIVGQDPGAVDAADIVRGAEELGVEVTHPVTPADVEAMMAAHRRHAIRPLAAIGVDVGSDPDHGDLQAAAPAWDALRPRVEQLVASLRERLKSG